MIPFNFHHFYYFYAIARAGSVSRAAKELRLSQPALSYQVKRFEDALGVRLFERKGRNLALTDEGRSSFSYARQIFDTGQEFADSLHDRSQKGRLRIQIGVLNSIPKLFAAALLKFILASEPAALVQLEEDTPGRMLQGLKDHFLDLVLADVPYHGPAEDGIENHFVAKAPVVFCAHPAVAARCKKLPRGLDGIPMILPTADSRTSEAVRDYLASRGVAPKIVAEVQDVELACRLAMEGLGVVPLNLRMAEQAPERKLVVLRGSPKAEIHESLYLYSKKRKNAHPIADQVLRNFRI